MPSPRLADLPPPPTGRTGWPWDVETPPLPPNRPDGSPWPRISIVTPSFNQGQFIEETIRSVLLQGYPDLEYIIMDGGSTDGAVDVIRKYAPWLTHWESEKDRGQSHAINKGLDRSTGAIFQWINSDDLLFPDACKAVAKIFNDQAVVCGGVENFEGASTRLFQNSNLSSLHLLGVKPGAIFHQPGIWLNASLARSFGPFDETMHYTFDWLYLILFLARSPAVAYTDAILVRFRIHPNSKTISLQKHFEDDILRSLRFLELQGPAGLRTIAGRQLKGKEWSRFVALTLANDFPGRIHRLSAATKIGYEALKSPRHRLNRWTLGAMRRLIFNSSVRTG